MASRKQRNKSSEGDQFTYAEFISDLVNGRVEATELIDPSTIIREIDINVTTEDENGNVVNIVIKHPLKRLTSIEFDDPSNGNSVQDRKENGTRS